MSDAELLRRAQGGDELAFQRLADRYRALRWKIAGKYHLPSGGDNDDLRQEAMVGFHKAVRDYGRAEVPFSAFAYLCIERQVITAVKTATRHKHEPLNKSVSMEMTPPGCKDDGSTTLADTSAFAAPNTDAAEILDGRRELRVVASAVTQHLSPLEQSAVIGRADGLSYDEIAEREGLNFKQVDNAAQRAKLKLGRALRAAA